MSKYQVPSDSNLLIRLLKSFVNDASHMLVSLIIFSDFSRDFRKFMFGMPLL